MPYRFHRVFFAAPLESTAELQAFHDVAGEVNEAKAMPLDLLLTPGCLTAQMGDKRFFQPAVESNIRDAALCLFVLRDTWGPATRNFESDYQLALACAADPNLPMQAVALLFDKSAAPRVAELAGLPGEEYDGIEEFRARVTAILTACVDSLGSATADAAGDRDA